MSIQIPPLRSIPPGFGQRLREERKRLKLSQAELGQAGGCGRLAQLQYESEATSPTVRYIDAVGAAGVDLGYLMFGVRSEELALETVQAKNAEDRAFDLVEKCAAKEPDKRLSADAHKVLFRLFRSYATQVELGQLPADFDPVAAIASRSGQPEKKSSD